MKFFEKLTGIKKVFGRKEKDELKQEMGVVEDVKGDALKKIARATGIPAGPNFSPAKSIKRNQRKAQREAKKITRRYQK